MPNYQRQGKLLLGKNKEKYVAPSNRPGIWVNVPALAKPFFTRTVLMDHTLLLPLKPGCTSVEDANSKLSDNFDGVDIAVEEEGVDNGSVNIPKY